MPRAHIERKERHLILKTLYIKLYKPHLYAVMLLILIASISWVAIVASCVALCSAASRGDAASESERREWAQLEGAGEEPVLSRSSH